VTIDATVGRRGAPIAALAGIVKHFGGVTALAGVSLELLSGEVHVLLGENGAGKSTLVGVLIGALETDAGEVAIQGQRDVRHSPAQARQAGINAVLQDFSLAPSLTVYENLFLGREMTQAGLLRKREMRQAAIRSIADLGVDIDVDAKVVDLSRAEQQIVEIIRALGGRPGALLLDEPTATLSHEESDRLFSVVERIKGQGWGILYITHRLEEVRRLGDRVTVLRDGALVGSHALADISDDGLIQEMVGRSLTALYPEIHNRPGEIMLRLEGVTTSDRKVRDASIAVRTGEIVGIAGLVGCGKSELARACFGLQEISAGRVEVKGEVVADPSPRRMLRLGMTYLPQDRRGEALALNRSIKENVSIEALEFRPYSRWGLRRPATIAKAVDAIAERLDIRPRHIEQRVDALSGGNQQKVVLGRALTRERLIYIFDEPTSGIDVGARQEIYGYLKTLCEGGAAILLVSSDLPELLHLAQRVYVMHRGRIEAELAGTAITDEAVVRHSFGHRAAAD
jgi:ribose transport system ATP-binding protein